MQARVVIAYGAGSAHSLLRAEAAAFHGVPAERLVLARHCPVCGSNAHGRPLLLPTAALRRPAHVSLARAGRMSIVALTDAAPIGVDLEAEGAASFPGFADVVLHERERGQDAEDPTHVWVRKEAVLKACGTGLAVDPRGLGVDRTGTVTTGPSDAFPDSVWLRELEVAGHVAAVAVLVDRGADLALTVRPSSA